jgi:hypothetical protein
MIDFIYYALHLLVYISVGSILAELSTVHASELIPPGNKKAVYVILMLLWPLCIVLGLYAVFNKGIR